MTENTTLTDAKRDGRAQAAAEKAYRKASRPWFKKKRFIIPLIIVVIAIVSSMANGGKGSSSATATPATEPSAAAAAAPAAAAPAAEAAPAKAAPEVVQVEAGQLLTDFKGNEAAADAKYKGKTLQVTGFVNKVDTEFLDKDQYIVRVDNGDKYNFLHVNCNDLPAARAATIVPGSAITVRVAFRTVGTSASS